ncbi:MAG: hypothetical protein IGS39_00500 [Calothrix sp. C42_A2020_038]|nr:hypothetical protein [Calothrix sp. C42_A2020_038]
MNIRYLPLTRWWHWIVCILLVTGGLGVSAVTFLVKSPQENSCASEADSDTAAAAIYCATTSVDDQDADKLSRAIQLVNTIPKDDPLRSNADNLIERWSQAIIHLSQKAFHEGDLRKAVEMAKEIPPNHPYHQIKSKHIQKWQSIWSQAEDIYKAALSEIEDSNSKNWYNALSKAKQLKTLDNEHWANSKYYELIRHIQSLREQDERRENEVKADQSQKEEASSDNSDNLNMASLSDSMEDSTQLAKARAMANSGKIDDMRAALVEASVIISEPHRQAARKLMTEIEQKIAVLEDSSYLEEAKKLAKKNDEISLKMAINEASLIGRDRPLYKQANQYIATWNNKISLLAVQPVKSITTIASKQSSKTPENRITKIAKAPKIPQNPKNQSQTSSEASFYFHNELKPVLTNQIKEPFSLEQLEKMQIKNLQEAPRSN